MWRKLIKKKRNKYGNKPVSYEGMKFDSGKEFERWLFLKEAEQRGEISNLRRQVKFQLLPSVVEEYEVQLKTKTKTKTRVVQQAVFYICDFCYKKDGAEVVEDVKASPNKAVLDKTYTLKKKMMKSLKGIDIKEVYDGNDEI
jgi:hypothetical protein